MNKILFSLLFICMASASLYAQDTIRVYYDANWKEISDMDEAVFYRKAYPEGNNTWRANDYYASNKIQMTGTYKSKKLEIKQGHFIYYYENGNKSSEGDYIDDKYMGLWYSWFENGHKKWEGDYKDNVSDGLWKYWYESGEKKTEGNWVNDKKTGVWHYWHINGQVECVETFTKGGSSSFITYHENGAKSCEGTTEDNKPEGLWTYWNSDGRVFFKGNFHNGLKEGEWTRSFPKGEMKLQYKYGIIDGKQLGGIDQSE
jgi:uncharacterized protein